MARRLVACRFGEHFTCALADFPRQGSRLRVECHHHPGLLPETPHDPAAFADAVVWMRDHPDELREMKRRARRLAERDFDRNRLADGFVQVLEEARATFY